MLERKNAEFAIIRASERKRRAVPGNPMSYQELSPDGIESLAMFAVTAAPGQSTGTGSLQHGGDEALVVLSGRMEIEVEGQKQSLESGDSAFIPRGHRHRLTNVGSETAQAVFVLSPPKY
jgi:quercetin dioxygenase-like cupin family protein